MARVELQIPYTDKEEARRRGARWDGEQKTWYIPEGVDHSGFARWLPTARSPNMRARDWFLAGRKNIAEILKDLT